MATITSFYTRNPRISIAILVTLFISTLLFFNSDPYLSHGPRRPPPPPGMYVEDVIQRNEQSYKEALKDRQKMIRKWGPYPSGVDAFPSHGEFYTMWDFFTPAFQCPHKMERIGTLGDGGKWVCGFERVARQDKCVIYSFGINGESSFEASLLERAPGCEVWGYDFSVSSFGPEITANPNLSPRSHFHSFALGSSDDPNASPPTFTLQTLMHNNGHRFIDVLKIDIEGAEFEAFESFFEYYSKLFTTPGSKNPAAPARPYPPHRPGQYDPNVPVSAGQEADVPVLPIGQLQIEIHAREGSEYGSFSRFLKWWENLERMGLRPFWTEPNLVYVNLIRGARPDLVEYSLMNIRGKHALVSGVY